MHTDKEIFEFIKDVYPLEEPRKEFVVNTEDKLKQKARGINRRMMVKRTSFTYSGVVLCVIAMSWFFLFSGKEAVNNTINTFVEGNTPENEASYSLSQFSSKESEVVPTDVNDLQELLMKKDGLFDQVRYELNEAGYNSPFAGIVYSKDDIRISLIIPDNELVTEQKNAEVNRIFQDMIIKHNMNPKAFIIEVSHAENSLYNKWVLKQRNSFFNSHERT